MIPLIILTGPTTSKKSDTAVALAEKLGAEIINADSMQVYKYFDIGTAKPSLEVRQRVRHHLIDILEPDETFNAFDFKSQALKHIREILKAGKIPIVVGGTGLYIKVLTEDHDCAAPISKDTKNAIQSEIQKHGVEFMHQELKKIDPESASAITTTDALRIERALGVYRQTGKKFSAFHADESAATHDFPIKTFLLQWDRENLYDNINKRVDAMIEKGLADEVKNLLNKGHDKTLKPFQSIGYAQMVHHLDGGISLDRAIYEIKRETRHYAKRQITWFKKTPNTISIPADNRDTPATLRDKVLSHLPKAMALVLACALSIALPSFSWAEGASPYKEGVKLFHQGKFSEAQNRLLAVASTSADPAETKRARYLLGRIHLEKNKPEKAIELFNKSLKEYPKIEDYLRFSLAQAYSDNGQKEAALKQIKESLKKFPKTTTYSKAQFLRAEILIEQGKTGQAVKVLQQAVKHISRKSSLKEFKDSLPEMILRLGQLHLELEQKNNAYAQYRRLYIYHSSSPLTLESLPEMHRLENLPDVEPVPLNFDERSERIKNLLQAVRFEQVITEIREIPQFKSTLPDKFYFYLSRAYKGLRKRSEAIQALKTFLKKYPKHRRVGEAHYDIGRQLWNLNRDQDAIRHLKKAVGKSRVSNIAIRSQFIIGRIHEGNKNYGQALKQYNRLVSKFNSAEYAQWGAWRMGWVHYQRGHFKKADKQFKENARHFPAGDFIEYNLFWQAKSLEKLKQKNRPQKIYREVSKNYPYTFYGIRAEERLQRDSVAVPAKKKAAFSVKKIALKETKKNSGHRLNRALTWDEKFRYSRAVEMIGLGFYKNARREISHLEKSVRKNLAGVMWLSHLYNQAQSYTQSVRLLHLYKNFKTKNGEKTLSQQFWKHFFPLAHADTIGEISETYDIDPYFVKGLIRQESLFEAKALSGAGARGLMQIMPATGKSLYTQGRNKKPFDVELLFEPDFNIALGIKYLSQLNKRFGNNGTHILISYNAGPHVLKKWLKRFSKIDDPDVFIESIPYPETRRYVKHVLRNHGVYKSLYQRP
jgi:tRNA dimethylallyltransferase